MYSREIVEKETLDYFNQDALATNVWIDKYCLKDKDGNLLEKTPDDMHHRLAREFARIETKYPNPMDEDEIYMETNENNNVEIYGKLAKFPQGTKASKAFNWVYNLKDPKLSSKDIWYLMVEKQDNSLQMIKYQKKQGVNLTKFIVDLKKYYEEKYKNNYKLALKFYKIFMDNKAK